MPRYISTKRAAFHSLFAKLREAFTFSSEKRISLPGALPVARVKRKASAAVLVDHQQRINTVAQGLTHLATLCVTHQAVDQHRVEAKTWPMCSTPEKIILATQKKIMS